MAEATFLEQNGARPGAALTVVLMHGAGLAALLLVKPEIVERVTGFTPIDIIEVRTPPPPPPNERPVEQRHVLDRFVPPVPPTRNVVPAEDAPVHPPDLGARPGGDTVAEYVPPGSADVLPRPTPVRVAARMLGSNLQPDYPASEQRMEREGRVVIQVTIGADGRVRETRRLSATSDAFWLATERHARRSWRFRPATVDGRAVESTRTLTVHFELHG